MPLGLVEYAVLAKIRQMMTGGEISQYAGILPSQHNTRPVA
jgi:hypothetical protein